MAAYKPPFTMTDEITALLVEASDLAGRISVTAGAATPVLRRQNRIRTIYSSLAIEQNTLTLDQVTAVLNGKRVLAPPQDIREVQNAYEAYDHLSELDSLSLRELLKAHRFMMAGLTQEAGMFRSGNVGVIHGNQLIHAGTPATYVPEVMAQLFDWLKTSRLPLLLTSCIFHYEFEFIHPFSDGNGRTGRLWHSLLLQRWKPFFAWMPVETLIHERQNGYYAALNAANNSGQSTAFVAFMLTIIRDALKDLQDSDVGENVGENVGEKMTDSEEKILDILRRQPEISARKLSEQLGLTSRQVERLLASLRAKNRIVRVGPAKGGSWKIL